MVTGTGQDTELWLKVMPSGGEEVMAVSSCRGWQRQMGHMSKHWGVLLRRKGEEKLGRSNKK